jgi:hypothetical protein
MEYIRVDIAVSHAPWLFPVSCVTRKQCMCICMSV